jgi:hypothetical protein
VVAALLVFLLIGAFYGFAFGFTRLLLRGSAWEQYSLEAPLLTGPAFVVLALSLLGYRLPAAVPPWQAWVVLAAGAAASAFVLGRDRRELLALLRAHWPRLATVLAAAACAAAALLVYFPGNEWDQFFAFMNGEYLNYAEMAALLTGQHQSPPGQVGGPYASFRVWRDGQDLVLAAVAQLTRLHPVRAILPVAVLFRFQHSAALGLLVCGLAGGRGRYGLALVALLLDAVLLFETQAFSLSFFSANCAAPLYAVYLALLATQREFGRREACALVLMNLFFLMTYPEWLFVVKGLEAAGMVAAVLAGRRRYWRPLLACNLLLVAAHPALVWRKAAATLGVAQSQGGWNVLGDPLRGPAGYLQSCFGLGAACVPQDVFVGRPGLGVALVAVAAVVTGFGAALLARRRRLALPILLWLALLGAGHVFPALKHSGPWYVPYKVLSQTYFVVILAAAAVLLVPASRWRYGGLLLIALWLSGAAYASYRLIPAMRGRGQVIAYAALRDGLRAAPGETVASACRAGEPLRMLALVSGETGTAVVPLSPAQRRALASNVVGRVREPGPPVGACRYEGLLLVDGKVSGSGPVAFEGRVLGFECQEVLGRAGSVTLCRGRLSLPWALTLPAHWWISQEQASTPPLWARSRRLRVTGELPPWWPVSYPYHITCAVGALGWSQDIEVDHAGPFCATLDLPGGAAGREVVLTFRGFATLCPARVLPGSGDTRHLGFLLKRVESLPPVSAADKPTAVPVLD